MKKMLLLTAALAFVAVPAAAHAQPTTPQADEQNAQAYSDQAYDAYEKGNFPKAVQLYLESYKLNPTAEVLYNVASIYDKKLNDPRLALEYYRRHNAAPDAKGDLVGKATARIAALQNQLDNPNGTAGGGAPGGRADQGDPGATYKTAGIIVGGVGVVGIAVGAVTGLIASGKHSDAKSAGCSGDICTSDDALSKEKDAKSMATVSTITFIAGGVLLAGGAALYLLAPKHTSSGTTRGSIQVAPQGDLHGGGMAVFGRF